MNRSIEFSCLNENAKCELIELSSRTFRFHYGNRFYGSCLLTFSVPASPVLQPTVEKTTVESFELLRGTEQALVGAAKRCLFQFLARTPNLLEVFSAGSKQGTRGLSLLPRHDTA